MEENGTRPSSLSVDDILKAVADPYRRSLLDYLSSVPENRCSVSELVNVLRSEDGLAASSQERIRQRLHHVHLPKLRNLGLIEHDEESDEVQYVESPRMETVIGQIRSDPGDDPADRDASGDESADRNQ